MSSIDPHAYDALGRILSSGGEQSLALALGRGYPGSRTEAMMLRRFGGDYSAASSSLTAFATGMLRAGALANQRQETGGELDPSEIPMNGFLDDDEMGGTRFKWSADVTFEGASSAVTVYLYTATSDIEQMINEALAAGYEIVDNYRGKFGLGDDATLTPTSVQFLTGQRAY